MAMDSMTVANTHHPEVLNVSEVIMYYKRILICFFLAWNKSLPCFNGIHLYRPHILTFSSW
jgi:hypothetical protein